MSISNINIELAKVCYKSILKPLGLGGSFFPFFLLTGKKKTKTKGKLRGAFKGLIFGECGKWWRSGNERAEFSNGRIHGAFKGLIFGECGKWWRWGNERAEFSKCHFCHSGLDLMQSSDHPPALFGTNTAYSRETYQSSSSWRQNTQNIINKPLDINLWSPSQLGH